MLLRNLLEAIAVLLLFVWTYPGIENQPLFQSPLLIPLALLVFIITLRSFLITLLKYIVRKFRKILYYSVNELITFFTNKPSFKRSDLFPALVTNSKDNPFPTTKITHGEIINMSIVDNVEFTATIDQKNYLPDMNNYYRIGVSLSKDRDVALFPRYEKPCLHFSKDSNGLYFIDRYDVSGEHGRIEVIGLLPAQSSVNSVNIEVAYKSEKVLITFKIGSQIIHEQSFSKDYKYLKFLVWTDFQPGFRNDKGEYIIKVYPVYITGEYIIRK